MKLTWLAGLVAMGLPAIAQAGRVAISVGVGPGYCYTPRYYAPAPVYYSAPPPAATSYAPALFTYSPPPVVYTAPPPVVYGPTVVVAPSFGFYYGGHWGGYYHWRPHFWHHRR